MARRLYTGRVHRSLDPILQPLPPKGQAAQEQPRRLTWALLEEAAPDDAADAVVWLLLPNHPLATPSEVMRLLRQPRASVYRRLKRLAKEGRLREVRIGPRRFYHVYQPEPDVRVLAALGMPGLGRLIRYAFHQARLGQGTIIPAEAAQALGISPGAVRQLLYRLRQLECAEDLQGWRLTADARALLDRMYDYEGPAWDRGHHHLADLKSTELCTQWPCPKPDPVRMFNPLGRFRAFLQAREQI